MLARITSPSPRFEGNRQEAPSPAKDESGVKPCRADGARVEGEASVTRPCHAPSLSVRACERAFCSVGECDAPGRREHTPEGEVHSEPWVCAASHPSITAFLQE